MFNRGKGLKQQPLNKVILINKLKKEYLKADSLFLDHLYTLSKAPINAILTATKRYSDILPRSTGSGKHYPRKTQIKNTIIFTYLHMLHWCRKDNVTLNQEHNNNKMNLKNWCISFQKSQDYNITVPRSSKMKIKYIIYILEREEKVSMCTHELSQLHIS